MRMAALVSRDPRLDRPGRRCTRPGASTSTASPDAVFAVLADHERWVEWFPGLKRVDVLGPADRGGCAPAGEDPDVERSRRSSSSGIRACGGAFTAHRHLAAVDALADRGLPAHRAARRRDRHRLHDVPRPVGPMGWIMKRSVGRIERHDPAGHGEPAARARPAASRRPRPTPSPPIGPTDRHEATEPSTARPMTRLIVDDPNRPWTPTSCWASTGRREPDEIDAAYARRQPPPRSGRRRPTECRAHRRRSGTTPSSPTRTGRSSGPRPRPQLDDDGPGPGCRRWDRLDAAQDQPSERRRERRRRGATSLVVLGTLVGAYVVLQLPVALGLRASAVWPSGVVAAVALVVVGAGARAARPTHLTPGANIVRDGPLARSSTRLGLEPHPEGGRYRRTFLDPEGRASSILYLLGPASVRTGTGSTPSRSGTYCGGGSARARRSRLVDGASVERRDARAARPGRPAPGRSCPAGAWQCAGAARRVRASSAAWSSRRSGGTASSSRPEGWEPAPQGWEAGPAAGRL